MIGNFTTARGDAPRSAASRRAGWLVDRGLLGFLSLVFLWSGVDKILHYDGFVNALRNYVLLPRGVAPYLALPLISLEILIGIGLLLRPWRRAAALTAAITLVVFTAAVAVNGLYGDRGICGCWFTITLARSTGMHIVQNLLMLGVALSLWWDARRQPVPAGPDGPGQAFSPAISSDPRPASPIPSTEPEEIS